MYRFRKKSDARRTQIPEALISSLASSPASGNGQVSYSNTPTPRHHDPLPGLPPVSDFRTSLILPDLTRRFSLLRSATGDPVSLNDMRTRFAQQRAKGVDNQISEEEEDLLVEALDQIREANTQLVTGSVVSGTTSYSSAPHTLPDDSMDTSSDYMLSPSERQSSVRSTNTSTSSALSGSIGRHGKRHSNHLFNSARFRDQSYMRSVAQKSGSSRSINTSDSTTSGSVRGNASMYGDSLRPTTPESSGPSASVTGSPSSFNDRTPVVRSAPLLAPHPYESPASQLRLSKAMTPAEVKRLSLALEQVIREIEDEGEDEVVLPRSPYLSRVVNRSKDESSSSSSGSNVPNSISSEVERGTAIVPDSSSTTDHEYSPYPRPGTASPTPRIPGYTPGMPRPRTPRNVGCDDSRPDSTTPRPTSPGISTQLSDRPGIVSPVFRTGVLRRGSNPAASRSSPQLETQSPAASAAFLPRSNSGQSKNGDDTSFEFGQPYDSSIIGRRRPASPLAESAYQPMAVSSRPGTPSNVTWNPSISSPKSHSRTGSISAGHSRNGSFDSAEFHSVSSRVKSSARSLRSPALPDSPLLEGSHGNSILGAMSQGNNTWRKHEDRPPSAMSGITLGSPVLITQRTLRSPTPTRYTPQSPTSPTSPTFSEYQNKNNLAPTNGALRSQTPPSSPFTQGPLNPLILPPMPNSSRSSLVSTGSSYHSWEEEHNRNRGFDLTTDFDSQRPPWHDLSAEDDDLNDPEEVLRQVAGLTKFDFIAIQDKLFQAAKSKAAGQETRERVPSLRRRRPSNAHSISSITAREIRSASPAPPTSTVSSPPTTSNTGSGSSSTRWVHSDNARKEMLDSLVVNSIKTPAVGDIAPAADESKSLPLPPSDEQQTSSPARRHRDLADAVFGISDSIPALAPLSPTTPRQETSTYVVDGPTTESIVEPLPLGTAVSPVESLVVMPSSPRTPASQQGRFPQAVDHTALEREVQRRADAAMVALRRSPSQHRTGDTGGTATKKRVNTSLISTPRLVSATTSVDTIPLPSPSAPTNQRPAPSKISERIKKLKGTLRTKPSTPIGGEVTPWTYSSSPPAIQTAHYPQSLHSVPNNGPTRSATELGGFKVSIPNPPASAPGLRGFMARFRKPRQADHSPDYERRQTPQSSPQASSTSTSPHDPNAHSNFVRSAQVSPESTIAHRHLSPSPHPQTPVATDSSGLDEPSSTDEAALRQLFDAASKVGLKEEDLTDLLARSQSITSRSTTWSRSPALVRSDSVNTASRVPRMDYHDRITPEGPFPSSYSHGTRRSIDSRPSPSPDFVVRKPSLKKPVDVSPSPRLRDGQAVGAANTIVRRTIIFPSEHRVSTAEPSAPPSRKNSQSRKRRSGGSVQSGRSVHDRAPTPPPPARVKRFSAEASPPVPQLPTSISSRLDASLNGPHPATAAPLEKSNSAYDSLYEMYASETRVSHSGSGEPLGYDSSQPSQSTTLDTIANSDSGPALEVIEMANGETIWSIVNGLRDDDVESVFQSRASVGSEYSLRDVRDNTDGVQIFFKEHKKMGSKGSNSSYATRKKALQSSGTARPETKVFYSSSAQIGRLIENLSKGMDSGSFNIMPNSPPGQAENFHFEPDMHWTVEERLEHMLGSLENP